ncbi:MAG: DUF1127 domain-containing protein [Pseudolabrys sp.]
MNANIPVLPIAGSALARALLALVALVTHWLKQIARARKHRRDARVLASFDHRMLADIGVTRSDLHDAFSQPFWDDPTALLRERVNERRGNRPRGPRLVQVQNGYRRPATNRPARQAV